KIITNAGGLNPASAGAQINAICDELGISLDVRVIEGDDLYGHKVCCWDRDKGNVFGCRFPKFRRYRQYKRISGSLSNCGGFRPGR
ncbi:MAG: acyclic terpene utilization AtuA family protein, partial [Hahellaceae bacterium]|nr:acyclic terpene utilization AtuA family protein [Hahellaceae bacterium]